MARTAKAKATADLFGGEYTAKDIEVLEGLEPVRKRPGMYIGGTDEKALHHLFAEVLDNAMDEAVAGHATRIEVELHENGYVSVTDNGRGIPVDPHPKFKNKSALEVIMTTLHAGGKFEGKAYQTSGGLHGVGVSVVNALSDDLIVEVCRNRTMWRQAYSRGKPRTRLEKGGDAPNRRGTMVMFHPDPEIFGDKARFRPARLHRMARSKAYLFGGVEIRWKCAPSLIKDDTPAEAVFRFEQGLTDYLASLAAGRPLVVDEMFAGKVDRKEDGGHGSVEWAVVWGAAGFGDADGFVNSYCNTIPTAEGGTHENGLRAALSKGLKAYADMTNNKKAAAITPEDAMGTAGALLSVFIRNPEFQGQTKDKLATAEAARLVENAVRPAFDHWLASHPKQADQLLQWVIDRADERQRRRREKEVSRAAATRKLRLPGKLADCTQKERKGTEIFLVEGDSAGGSAKQARNRATQAILPLRGKILNVASAGRDKIAQNQEIQDIVQALGVGLGPKFDLQDLRYEKVIIMTDADVDGAHIAALLITFFHQEMPELINAGRLYLAQPPLYRLTAGGKSVYAMNEEERDRLVKTAFKPNQKVEVSRFKGLGEMMPAQLKETTMNPETRALARVVIPEDRAETAADLVERLMGRRPEARFQFIQENAAFVREELDI
ncbi:DNA topoisomerase IV subunit B [Amphiplicatus metriothermophilus]|uniref:DNA topoisomerase 4 subunit B n=1 Tax=Amphiplicatus metriothermophilus TaxID=1519374 RepID=A0A239PTS4_9PROT|nr:topoisomerase-4 subunit B [Amphiplicatus metriothermophilus]